MTIRASTTRSLVLIATFLTWVIGGRNAIARVIPNDTLGNKASEVIPDTTVWGLLSDVVIEGAVRGPNVAQEGLPNVPDSQSLPDRAPEPELLPTPIPSPEELLPLPETEMPGQPLLPGEGESTFTISQFEIVGNTAISDTTLQAAVKPYTKRPITLTELLAARTAVTQVYIDAGYINSGAFIPAEQVIAAGEAVTIQVVEGRLEAINIEGLHNLNPGYLSSRIGVRVGQPLNVNVLIEALQLLQLDPLIDQISAELATGNATGGSILNLAVTEADVTLGAVVLDNGRSPIVGSFRRRVTLTEGNVLGLGDRISVGYSNTNGSNSWDVGYTVPINPYNGTLSLSYSGSNSRVIDPNFAILGIQSNSEDYQLGVRQPIYQTPSQEFALGLQLSRSASRSSFQLPGAPRLAFPSEGADLNGETRVTALRFSQEWTQRAARQVFAARSQFNVGVDWLNATVNAGNIPDSNFLSWQGQTQFVQVLENDVLMLLRLNGQFANQSLLSLEQFRLGGQGSVRGYRQDQATTDNGLFASAEVRFPIFQIPNWESTVQLTPFVDYGWGWNAVGGESEQLLGIGTGLLLQMGDRVNARLDFGIPLIDPGAEGNSLQESGLLFTVTGTAF